jgi:2-polyprenyl-6-methoxyphenol hydroxylase-like FAD-dependent oxidoreductase
MRTQVAIIGAGPAGLLLGALLHQAGVDAVIVEQRSADYVLGRIRAGVLEQTTVDLLERAGVGYRVQAEGLRHDGTELAFGGTLHRIDFHALTGRHVVVYGQTEVTRDLMAARAEAGLATIYDAANVAITDHDGAAPRVTFDQDGVRREIACDFTAGCDGFLAQALAEFYGERSEAGIAGYSARCLSRIWKAERFSWWFTSLMHRFPEAGEFGARLQRAELDYLVCSKAAATALAENYVGLPMD